MLSAAGMGKQLLTLVVDFEAPAYITLTNDEAGFSRFLTFGEVSTWRWKRNVSEFSFKFCLRHIV